MTDESPRRFLTGPPWWGGDLACHRRRSRARGGADAAWRGDARDDVGERLPDSGDAMSGAWGDCGAGEGKRADRRGEPESATWGGDHPVEGRGAWRRGEAITRSRGAEPGDVGRRAFGRGGRSPPTRGSDRRARGALVRLQSRRNPLAIVSSASGCARSDAKIQFTARLASASGARSPSAVAASRIASSISPIPP